MSVPIPSKSKRLSREESKAQTRARLISVGRKYFLRYGFTAATAEQISENAGFTRGALHSNFEDKEGLFLEVVRKSQQRRCAFFESLVENYKGEELLVKMREALADLMGNPDFLLLMEFELQALRNDKLRRSYLEFNKEIMRDALRIVDGIRSSSDVHFVMDTADFVIAITSFVRGLAARRALLGDLELSESRSRNMVYSVFGSGIAYPTKNGERKNKP